MALALSCAISVLVRQNSVASAVFAYSKQFVVEGRVRIPSRALKK